MKLAKPKEYKIIRDRKNFVCIFITLTDGFIASHFMMVVCYFLVFIVLLVVTLLTHYIVLLCCIVIAVAAKSLTSYGQ